jgi:hypothetical protein
MKTLFEMFTNLVLCRIESRQHKAKCLWKKLAPLLSSSDRHTITVEWSHYIMGDIDTNQFGGILKAIRENYEI